MLLPLSREITRTLNALKSVSLIELRIYYYTLEIDAAHTSQKLRRLARERPATKRSSKALIDEQKELDGSENGRISCDAINATKE